MELILTFVTVIGFIYCLALVIGAAIFALLVGVIIAAVILGFLLAPFYTIYSCIIATDLDELFNESCWVSQLIAFGILLVPPFLTYFFIEESLLLAVCSPVILMFVIYLLVGLCIELRKHNHAAKSQKLKNK